MKYARILVPTDLSKYSVLAAKEAMEHLRPGGHLRLLYIAEPQYVMAGGPEGAGLVYDQALTAAHEAKARKQLHALAAALGRQSGYKILRGYGPAPLIAAEAKRFKAGLILLSTHGRGGIDRMLFGSVAQKLLRLHKGPVLMLRPGR
jgi:nucleotide-binding universal stress UspA family protein